MSCKTVMVSWKPAFLAVLILLGNESRGGRKCCKESLWQAVEFFLEQVL